MMDRNERSCIMAEIRWKEKRVEGKGPSVSITIATTYVGDVRNKTGRSTPSKYC
jgi:hypothetical protein